MAAKKPKLGELIDKLVAKRGEISAMKAETKKLQEEEEKIELQVIEAADREKVGGARGSTHSATIKDEVMPNLKDWDEFVAFIVENKYFHLVHKRLSTPGCRELFELGKQIPGVERFMKRKVGLNVI